MFGQEYTIAARSARRIAHEVADKIHQDQRGVRGVARTRLAFVSDRVRESLLGTVEKRSVKEVYVVRLRWRERAADYKLARSEPESIVVQRRPGHRLFRVSSGRRARHPGVVHLHRSPAEPDEGPFPRRQRICQCSRPTGRQIAFAAIAEGASAHDIFVMNADGTNRAPPHHASRQRHDADMVAERKRDRVHLGSHGAVRRSTSSTRTARGLPVGCRFRMPKPIAQRGRRRRSMRSRTTREMAPATTSRFTSSRRARRGS